MEETKDSRTLQKAELQLVQLGLPIPNQPREKVLVWPENVADLDGPELANHLSWCAAWSSYARYQLARSETNYAAFQTELSVKESIAIVNSKGDHSSVTETKASVYQLPEIQRLKAKLLESEALKKMIKSLLDGYEMKYATISREISRRSHEWDEKRS